MGLGFFVLNLGGHGYVYHDGDQGGFFLAMLIDPARNAGSLLVVNPTDTGAPTPAAALHTQSNTEPEAGTDFRITLHSEIIDHVFSGFAPAGKSRLLFELYFEGEPRYVPETCIADLSSCLRLTSVECAGASADTEGIAGRGRRRSGQLRRIEGRDLYVTRPAEAQHGKPVHDAKTWNQKRRPEIVQMLETQQFGRAPGRPADESFRSSIRARQH